MRIGGPWSTHRCAELIAGTSYVAIHTSILKALTDDRRNALTTEKALYLFAVFCLLQPAIDSQKLNLFILLSEPYPMKEPSNFLRQKLEGIHATLMQAHSDSAKYAPSITGAEREIINRSLLALILAPGYRVGSGTIFDQYGHDSGQVDIVIEQPFSISFPINSDQNRLFLAPSVCAAFEVKSDLKKQGNDAMKKASAIKALLRVPVKKGDFHLYDDISIPTFIIGFKGPSTEKGIEKIYKTLANKLNPNGILSIEGEIFYGKTPGKEGIIIANGKAGSLFAFLQCVTQTLQHAGGNEFKLDKFRSLIGETQVITS